MPDELAAVRAELARLRRRVEDGHRELLELVVAGKVPLPADRLPLDAFALLVGRGRRTLLNDITSSDPQRRLRWPRFIQGRGPKGELVGGRYTTLADLREWEKRGDASHVSAPVDAALQRRLSR